MALEKATAVPDTEIDDVHKKVVVVSDTEVHGGASPPATKVEVVDRGTGILLVPIPRDPFRAARGSLKGILSTADLLTARRQERQREHGH